MSEIDKSSRSEIPKSFQQDISSKLAGRQQKGRLRVLPEPYSSSVEDSSKTVIPSEGVDFSTNDYLGFAHTVSSEELLSEDSRFGSASSRLLSGNMPEHIELERELAEFLGFEDALLFGSAYLANVGLLSALVGRKDIIISDRNVHASLLDGIQLSRAKHLRFRHNSLEHLAEQLSSAREQASSATKILVVTESVFSMTGALAPVREILELAVQFDAAVVIDEAHSVGVAGSSGRGYVHDIEDCSALLAVTISFGKALGSYGGAVLGSSMLKQFLLNEARTAIYNTALPPVLAAVTLGNLKKLRAEKLFAKVQENSKTLREHLGRHEFSCDSLSHIIPVKIGDDFLVTKLAEKLRLRGVKVSAIRTPTVPEGGQCLRFSVTALHTEEQIRFAVECLVEEFGSLQ